MSGCPRCGSNATGHDCFPVSEDLIARLTRERDEARRELEAVTAERDRLQHEVTAAQLVLNLGSDTKPREIATVAARVWIERDTALARLNEVAAQRTGLSMCLAAAERCIAAADQLDIVADELAADADSRRVGAVQRASLAYEHERKSYDAVTGGKGE